MKIEMIVDVEMVESDTLTEEEIMEGLEEEVRDIFDIGGNPAAIMVLAMREAEKYADIN